MPDPFPPDRGLQLRMVVALLTAAALAVAALAVVVWLAVAVEWWLALVVAGFAAGGLVAGPAGRRARGGRRRSQPGAERGARELVERLAAVGDVRVPAVVLDADDAPLAWTTALPWRRPTIHLTSGLAERCTTRELEVDLRLAADLEMLNFLPAASGRDAGIWATHPPLARRLAQLDRMERELQEVR